VILIFLHFLFQCNKSCGEGGYQHRQVRCQSHIGEVLADSLCSALERPNDQHRCDLPQCHVNYNNSNLKPVTKEYQWRTSPWSQVSSSLYSLKNCFYLCLHHEVDTLLPLDSKLGLCGITDVYCHKVARRNM
jgi:hypothetical protein